MTGNGYRLDHAGTPNTLGQKMSQSMPKVIKKAGRNEARDTVVVIIEALLIAVLFRTFLYQPFSIPTASMQQTMMIHLKNH